MATDFCGLSTVACDRGRERGREAAHLGICHGLVFSKVMGPSGYLYPAHKDPG